MKWKDTYDDSKLDADAEEDFFGEEDYSAWKKEKGLLGIVLKNPLMVLGLVLGVSLVVFMVVIVLRSGGGQGDSGQIRILESQLQQLEERLARTEQWEQRLARIENGDPGLPQLLGRLDRMEAGFNTRMDQLGQEIEKLKKRPVQAAPTDTQTSAQTSSVKTHAVSSGDTLYSIARHYGLTIQQLSSLNKLSAGAVIHPGQKLKVAAD